MSIPYNNEHVEKILFVRGDILLKILKEDIC